MNILVDIGHPAHVHYYRNLVRELEIRGHNVIWTVKDMNVAKQLLDYHGFKYITLPAKADGLIGKMLKQVQYDLKLLLLCWKGKVDLAIGTSVTVSHISKFSKARSIVFDDDDDEVQPLITKYVHPYSDSLLSPDSLVNNRKKRDTIFYPGYQELAYLHPNQFKSDASVLDELGISEGEQYFIMRFNAFKAHHDIDAKGLALEQKIKLVSLLKPLGRVFISTEREIEPELKEYQIKISYCKVHDILSFATLFIGDSQTMTTEAAILGTPALKCNSFAGRLSIPNELEYSYHLCYSFLPGEFEKLIEKIKELLAMPDLKEEWQRRRQRMLNDKIDVTSFMVWFVENYPESKRIMVENPDYLERFK